MFFFKDPTQFVMVIGFDGTISNQGQAGVLNWDAYFKHGSAITSSNFYFFPAIHYLHTTTNTGFSLYTYFTSGGLALNPVFHSLFTSYTASSASIYSSEADELYQSIAGYGTLSSFYIAMITYEVSTGTQKDYFDISLGTSLPQAHMTIDMLS